MQAAAAQQRSAQRPSRTAEQLRNSFNHNLYAISLSAACRMYGVAMPAEGLKYRAHNALWDAEVAGRLYFAMRGIAYVTLDVTPRLPRLRGGGGGCLLESAETSETLWDARRRELRNNIVLLGANDIALLAGAPLPLRPPPSQPPSPPPPLPPSPPPPLILPAAAETTALPAAASADARVLQLIIDATERMQVDASLDAEQRTLCMVQHITNGIPDIFPSKAAFECWQMLLANGLDSDSEGSQSDDDSESS